MKACNASGCMSDIKAGRIAPCYVFFGPESYLKEKALAALVQAVVGDGFAEFNLTQLECSESTPEQFRDAVESCPVMAQKKLVICKDWDLMKLPAAWKDIVFDQLEHLPDTCVLVFFYDTLEWKADKRLKLYQLLEKTAQMVEFLPLSGREMTRWLQQKFAEAGREVSAVDAEYLVFLCGDSMTNLQTEIQKLIAFTDGRESVSRADMDTVCIKSMDAVLFDLTDHLTDMRGGEPLRLLRQLIAQKNDPIVLLAAISSHIYKLYAVKLSRGQTEREQMAALGTRSAYYVKKMSSAAAKLSLPWLRRAILACAQCDMELKTTQQESALRLEMLLLQLAQLKEEVG